MIDPLREGLSLLAGQLGRPATVAQLGDGMALDAGRLPLSQAPRAMRRAGLSARATLMPIDAAPLSLLPALLILKDGATRVLVARDDDTATLLIPETGGGRGAGPAGTSARRTRGDDHLRAAPL